MYKKGCLFVFVCPIDISQTMLSLVTLLVLKWKPFKVYHLGQNKPNL
jgi:hypothetical protein